MCKVQLKLAAAAMALALSTASFAAIDGQEGLTSQGQFNINLSLNPEVQISGLQDTGVNWLNDADTSSQPGNDQMIRQIPFCVYSSAAENRYTITMQSTNGPNTVLHTDPGNYMLLRTGDALNNPLYSYYIQFKDMNAGGAGQTMVQGQKISGIGSGELGCAGGNNAELEVHFRANDNVGLQPGVYKDVVQLTVEPE